jgi:hypothetical protein
MRIRKVKLGGIGDTRPASHNIRMATVVPAQIQQQFQSIIRFLGEDVGQEATRAYLRSLCAEASLDMLLGRNRRGKSALESIGDACIANID